MSISAIVKERPVLSAGVFGFGGLALLKLIRRFLVKKGPLQQLPQVTWAGGWMPVVGHVMRLKKYMTGSKKVSSGWMPVFAREVKATEGLDIFRMQIASITPVIVTDLDAIEEIITNDPKRFTKMASRLPAAKLAREVFGNGLIFADTDSEDWAIPHNILKAPFSTKGVKSLLPLMSKQADLLVECLKKSVGYGGVCHIDRWVTKMAFETIAVCATGTSFGSFDDDQDAPFIKALDSVLLGFGQLCQYPESLWPILMRKQLAQVKADGKLLRDTAREVTRKRRALETSTSIGKRDIMDQMLEEKDEKSGKAMTEEQIVDNVFNFLFAGQDSTAASMATVLCYLTCNPGCKQKLLEEIDMVVGKDKLEWDHLLKLRYLDWCIKEGMRLVPPVAALQRSANGDQSLLNKFYIPANTLCLLNIMGVHYDPNLWGEDAHKFRPERWEVGPPHKYAYLPFAIGPRACTGREFSVVEQKIALIKLLQSFDFRRPEGAVAKPGYTTLSKDMQKNPPFIDMDVELRTASAFLGLFSSFELLERRS